MVTAAAVRISQVLSRLSPGTHLCHFYREPRDLLDVLVPYFAAGLARNEKCLWVLDDVLDPETVRQALRGAVADFDRRSVHGQIELVEPDGWYLIDGRFDGERVLTALLDQEREALQAGYAGLRVAGNTLWAHAGHWRDFLAYERHVDRCLCSRRMTAVCTYPLARCSAADLIDVAKAHDQVLLRRDGEWEIIENSALERIRGELQNSHERLQALAHQMVEVERGERRRISKVLHDGLQQTLVAARMSLMQAKKAAGGEGAGAIARADDLLIEAMRECRTLTAQISPPVLHEAGLAAALRWLCGWFAEHHGLVVHADLPDEEPQLAETPRVFLFEAARELLFNVVKHAAVKHARLTLALDGAETALEVADGGQGCTPARDAAAAGGSFGLFSIRERLRMMNGRFALDSAPGQGCRVVVALPLCRVPQGTAAAAGALQSRTVPAHRVGFSPGPVRVLLADDHAIFRQGLARLLVDHDDIEVVGEAADGLEAVEMARRLTPDVVLMDVSMPRMNGIEATRSIHREQPSVRIVALSMHDHGHIAQSILDAGARIYLQKSGCEDELLRVIREPRRGPADEAQRQTTMVM